MLLNDENRYLFRFAWKSIRRNAGRSFFIGFSVSLAVTIAVWVVSIFDGMNTQIEDAVVKTNLGFFQLQDPLFAASTDSSSPQEWTSTLANQIVRPPVMAVSPELVLDGNILTPEGAAGLLVLGVDPDWHRKFMPIADKLVAGVFLEQNNTDGAIIGQELATVFKFNIGDQLVLNYQDVNGELRSEILKIRGIYDYDNRGLEKRFVYVNQPTWQTLFLNQDMGRTLFNRVAIMAPGIKYEDELRNRTKSTGLVFKSWKNLNPEMAVVLDFHDGMMTFFYFIIAVTITMTILAPVQMLWQERLKELRMMKIIGVPTSKFWKIGLFEVIHMILLSTALASFLLIIIIGTQSYTGIDFSFLNQGISIERAGIQMPRIVYPQISARQLATTFTFVIGVLGFSYIWSIHRTMGKLRREK